MAERRLVEAVDTAGVDPAVCGRAHRYVHGTSGHRVPARPADVHLAGPRPRGRLARGDRLRRGRTGDRLLVVAEDPGRRSSALLVFDAHDLTTGPCASIRLPGVPRWTGRPGGPTRRSTW
ncbi:hypothetical protein K7G98_14415 [Saccharothrix sp. MB29]|nr:hypothetical protein [Saccharothrix sp. MB29]